jgi:hypothetical protein
VFRFSGSLPSIMPWKRQEAAINSPLGFCRSGNAMSPPSSKKASARSSEVSQGGESLPTVALRPRLLSSPRVSLRSGRPAILERLVLSRKFSALLGVVFAPELEQGTRGSAIAVINLGLRHSFPRPRTSGIACSNRLVSVSLAAAARTLGRILRDLAAARPRRCPGGRP